MKEQYDVSGLMKFLETGDWPELFKDHMDVHFAPAAIAFDIDYDEIGAIIGGHLSGYLWGWVFEDFATIQAGDEKINLVEVYLKRRGWNERDHNKAYLKALANSVMSLYEVSEITPGQSFLARDLIRGGEPILVNEVSATKTLRQWERLAARIVRIGNKNILTGAMLQFSIEASAQLITSLEKILLQNNKRKFPLANINLAGYAPVFTNIWLINTISREVGEDQPTVLNKDGDEIEFYCVRFPLAKGIKQKEVANELDKVSDLEQINTNYWNWFSKDNSNTILGEIELENRYLKLSVNSEARAQIGTSLLSSALADLVRTPLTEIQTINQIMANVDQLSLDEANTSMEIPKEAIHEMLDNHYRSSLDEPIGMLGDLSPKDAVKTKSGRDQVANWLKFLESSSTKQIDMNDPITSYDFTWMWHELGIEKLRK